MVQFICGDIFNIEDKAKCKRYGVLYNQCCQECEFKHKCESACDYKNSFSCTAKISK